MKNLYIFKNFLGLSIVATFFTCAQATTIDIEDPEGSHPYRKAFNEKGHFAPEDDTDLYNRSSIWEKIIQLGPAALSEFAKIAGGPMGTTAGVWGFVHATQMIDETNTEVCRNIAFFAGAVALAQHFIVNAPIYGEYEDYKHSYIKSNSWERLRLSVQNPIFHLRFTGESMVIKFSQKKTAPARSSNIPAKSSAADLSSA